MRKFYVFGAIIVILIIIFVGHSLRGAALFIFEKPIVFLSEIFFDLKILWISLINYSDIMSQLSSITEKNYLLLSENSTLQSLKRENEELKNQLSIKTKSSIDLEPVRIFIFTSDKLKGSVFLNKGSKEGIQEGQTVIYSGNILIGFVEEVFPSQSRVKLITSANVSINVKTKNGVFGLARGSVLDGLKIEFISQDDPISEDDFIFTSGFDGTPENLIIGSVRKIENSENDLFKKVTIDPAFKKIRSNNAFVLK